MNKFQQILESLLDPDSVYTKSVHLIERDGESNLLATDRTIMVNIPKHLAPEAPFEVPSHKVLSGLINVAAIPVGWRLAYSLKDLEECLSKIPQERIEQTIECKECEGGGKVQWTYKHHQKILDCPICDGLGGILTGFFHYEYLQDNDTLIRIQNGMFFGKTFKYLKLLCEASNIDKFYLISTSEPNRGHLFEVGECWILIMPVMIGDPHFNNVLNPIL